MRKLSSETYIIFKAALIGAAFLFWSCEEENSAILGELDRDFADRTIINAFLTYKDSGVVRMELQAPIIEDFTLIDSPYTLMRKSVNIKFWNENSPKPNYLRADWAKIKDRQKFYEGKGNVVVINNDGDTLKTNHIFWDNLNRRIFTEDTVIIKRMDGSLNISNHGLTASEDFKEFTFYDNHGHLYIDEGEAVFSPQQSRQTSKPNDTIVDNDMIELESQLKKQDQQ